MSNAINRWGWCVLVVLCVAGSWPSLSEAAGNEARCTELGANCICSEPLNTASYTLQSSGYQWNANDTTTKECVTEAYVNGVLQDGSGFQWTAESSGEDINALPAGHSVTYVLRDNDSANGGFLGHQFSDSDSHVRRAIRVYRYYSTDYSFANESNPNGTCANSNKVLQVGGPYYQGPIFTSLNGFWSFYGISTTTGWDRTVDCCVGPGPGNTGSGPDPEDMKGKWFRFELVWHNSDASNPMTWEMYVKNVTDNTAEVKVIDSSQTSTGTSNTWTTSDATTVTHDTNINTMFEDMFRGAQCSGFASHSHFLAAAWSTDAGQRIGAAEEIEGSGSDTTPPAVPTGVYVTRASK